MEHAMRWNEEYKRMLKLVRSRIERHKERGWSEKKLTQIMDTLKNLIM